MLKTTKRRTYRSSSRKKQRSLFSCFFSFLALMVLFTALLVGAYWWFNRPGPLGGGIMYDETYDVVGKPSVDAGLIEQVLEFYGSPASSQGQSLYDLGVKYGIDPIYALAFFLQESRFGTTGVAQVTRSLGNIRATPGYDSYQGYRKYATWEEGFADWYKLIKEQYVQEWKLVTVSQIIPVYAPGSDHNDVVAYIHSVESSVGTWRSGEIQA